MFPRRMDECRAVRLSPEHSPKQLSSNQCQNKRNRIVITGKPLNSETVPQAMFVPARESVCSANHPSILLGTGLLFWLISNIDIVHRGELGAQSETWKLCILFPYLCMHSTWCMIVSTEPEWFNILFLLSFSPPLQNWQKSWPSLTGWARAKRIDKARPKRRARCKQNDQRILESTIHRRRTLLSLSLAPLIPLLFSLSRLDSFWLPSTL